jgi:hypothetical protein
VRRTRATPAAGDRGARQGVFVSDERTASKAIATTAQAAPDTRALSIIYGRCRSGRRWFWRAYALDYERGYPSAHGWANTETEALADVRAAFDSLAGGRTVKPVMSHNTARHELQRLNTEKRRAKPPSDARDTPVVEYLYWWLGTRYQIIKRTKRRVYYLKKGEDIDEFGEPHPCFPGIVNLSDPGVGFFDLQKLETDDRLRRKYFFSLEAYLADRRRYDRFRFTPEQPDLDTLRAAMAAAHPDRGGSSAAFIEARKKYIAARRAHRTAQENQHA